MRDEEKRTLINGIVGEDPTSFLDGGLESAASELSSFSSREGTPRLSAQVDFEPLGNWCLVKPIDSAIEAKGIIIPEAYGQTFRKGIVVCTGVGTVYSSGTFIECTVKPGDVVLYGKAAGLEVNLKEGAFLLLRESEMFGRVPR